MNIFDERYIIRRADHNDIEDIMQFIDCYWKPGHIMARNRKLFEYEFGDREQAVNFILAIDKTSKSIEGLYGFLFSAEDENLRDVWGSIWKVKEGNLPLLGIELWKRTTDIITCRYHLGTGANLNTTIPIMKTYFKRYVEKMKHFYIMNPSISANDFVIAKQSYIPSIQDNYETEQYQVYTVYNIEELHKKFSPELYKNQIPYKDLAYINKRYFEYPIYHYNVLAVEKDGVIKAVIVTRNQIYNNRTAVRIVDFIGEQLCFSGTGTYWNQVLQNPDVEYIDFYAYGYNEEYIKSAGFSILQDNDANIIPNYFNPYEQKNVDIWVHSPVENVTYCKADGDQDRPN